MFSLARVLLSRCLIGPHRQPRFVTRRCILVQDAFLDRLIDHGNGVRQHCLNLVILPGVERRPQLLDIGPDLGPITAIDQAPLLILADPLLC